MKLAQPILYPHRQYSVILADPAWPYADKSLHRGGSERHYRSMPMNEIVRLNVQALAAPDCVLFLWCTHPLVVRGVHKYVAERWGFDLKTLGFEWVKTRGSESLEELEENGDLSVGMGHWTRANPEPCYIGIRGNPKRVAADVRSVVVAPRGVHSAKPPEVRDRIVRLCGDVPRIELFARGPRVLGWDAWGDEIDA